MWSRAHAEPCSRGAVLRRSLTQVEPRSRRAVLRCYVAAFSACEKGSQWERTLELLREMRPATRGFSACEKASQWERTLELLRETPHVCNYNAAFNACEKGAQWWQAMELLQLAHAPEIQPQRGYQRVSSGRPAAAGMGAVAEAHASYIQLQRGYLRV